jgi:hypothetical protein
MDIFEAVWSHDLAAIDRILASGAAIETSDSRGWTALHHAAASGDVETVTVLLDRGADPNHLDRFGGCAMARAVFAGHGEVVRLLRARGGDPELGAAQLAREMTGPMAELFADLPAELAEPPPPVTVMKTGRIPPGPARAKWHREHDRLWKLLVPASGEAPTIQGELIRATGRLADEAYRNGNINWSAMHVAMCHFVERVLDDPSVFSAPEITRWRVTVAAIMKHHRVPDVSGKGSTYYRLSEAAVRWCAAKPELMPLRDRG